MSVTMAACMQGENLNHVSFVPFDKSTPFASGLDDSIYPYAHSFLNNNVTGRGLLSVTVDDLYKLQVEKVGHQEIILEALEHLRNLHHNLDTENLQYVSLKVACKARSLTNEIR